MHVTSEWFMDCIKTECAWWRGDSCAMNPKKVDIHIIRDTLLECKVHEDDADWMAQKIQEKLQQTPS